MAASSSPRLRYHAVTVIAGAQACPAAHALKDVRLLSLAAPRLPLADCDSPASCECRFQHHSDRRAGPRRDADRTGTPTRRFVLLDRRDRRGRREADFADDEY